MSRVPLGTVPPMIGAQRYGGLSIAAPGLVRELACFGELREASSEPAMHRILMRLVVVLVISLGAVAVMVIVGLVLADIAVAITGLFVGVVCCVFFCLTALVAYERLRSSPVIHENGIVAHQCTRTHRLSALGNTMER